MYHFFSLEKGCSLSVCCLIAWSICSLQPYRSSLPGLINNSQQWKQQTTCEKWGVLIASHFSQFGLGLTFFSEPLLRVDLKLAYTEKLLVWLQFVKTDGQKSQVQKQLIN